MAGIKIKWLSDEADAVSGAKKVSASLDDVATDMEKLVDAGHDLNKSNADIARDLSKIDGRPFKEVKQEVDKAERSSKDLSSELDDTRRSLDKVGDAARNAGDDGSAGLGKIKKGAQEVQQEVGQNLGEAVSSVRGDLSDLGQVGQDTLGGLAATVASMGPAGLAGAFALAAGAAGLGALTAGLEEAEAKRKDLEERANDLAQAYVEAGDKVLGAFASVERAQDVIGDPEKKKQVQDYAEALGVDFSVALGAYVGRAEDLETVQSRVNDALSENNSIVGENATQLEKTRAEQSKTYQANQDLINSGKELTQVATDAGIAFDQNSAYLRHVADTAKDATRVVDEFGDTVVTLPDGKQIYIDAETGKATEDVDAIEKKIYSVPDKTATVTVNVQDNATSQMDQIVRNISGRSVTVGVGTVLKPNYGG